MTKFLWSIVIALLPTLALAADGTGSLSFAPPASDYSVLFLSNLFGVVDGVLHGTGSQILGSMFGVFNSAVLALGGIIIMYTLLVSTMNTAHEGEMLGRKWSSLWIPVRSTLGLALLIPKTSGYCLMQIFVMWVVVQGVGAADKVWNAALSYLNRGGVIVQEQINPIQIFTGDSGAIALGAASILTGQVCMLGIQTTLENTRQGYLSSAQQGSGPCSGTPSATMQTFCNTAVPDFLGSINVVTTQQNNPTAQTFELPLPNFDSSTPYAQLNGICGSLQWNAFSSQSLTTIQQNITGISSNELTTAQMSRAIAIQQMYVDLTTVAQVMVNNNPQLNPPPTSNNAMETLSFSSVANEQFGVPFLTSGTPCTGPNASCMMWGADPSNTNSPPIFNGTEFIGAIQDYDGIMMPTLNLLQQAGQAKLATENRAFIDQAMASGWLMAGSYFINLSSLNQANAVNSNATDTDTGMTGSGLTNLMAQAFDSNGQCAGKYAVLCQWLNQNQTPTSDINNLITGATELQSPLPAPDFRPTSTVPVSGMGSSTVFGFLTNSALVNLPNEAAIVTAPSLDVKLNVKINLTPFKLPEANFPCGEVTILWSHVCLGRTMGDLIYNDIIRTIFNFLIFFLGQIINVVIVAFITLPLQGMAAIFLNSVKLIQVPTANPVIALANMGVNYVNFASELWIYLLELSVFSILIPFFGMFVMPLLSMMMPLLLAWLTIMAGIGFITAYYIPFMPYMIFTFASIGWFMAVIEAMVAAPIVALGVTHPEGEGPFGKGEQAIMLLMNVFLRPAMMIIGYIASIALAYVSVWVINAGFGNVSSFLLGGGTTQDYTFSGGGAKTVRGIVKQAENVNTITGYTSWAGVYALFFCILVYTMMYLTVVQKAFTLIALLPDKILRWIGGTQETIGGETAGWADETKKSVSDAGDKTMAGTKEMGKQVTKQVTGAIDSAVGSASEDAPSAGANPIEDE